MPSPKINCFTIDPLDEVAFAGMPLGEMILTSNIIPGFVRLGERCQVSLGGGGWFNYPDHDGQMLTRAKTAVISNQTRLIKAGPETKSIIVKIICHDLLFELEPLADGLNLWPGGYGDIFPFAQFGTNKNSSEKVQLYEISDGKSIFVVDQRRAIVRLNCVDGNPTVTHPDVPELVEFLTTRAEHQRKAQALDWALHNLRSMLYGAHDPLIRNAMAKLNRLRKNV